MKRFIIVLFMLSSNSTEPKEIPTPSLDLANAIDQIATYVQNHNYHEPSKNIRNITDVIREFEIPTDGVYRIEELCNIYALNLPPSAHQQDDILWANAELLQHILKILNSTFDKRIDICISISLAMFTMIDTYEEKVPEKLTNFLINPTSMNMLGLQLVCINATNNEAINHIVQTFYSNDNFLRNTIITEPFLLILSAYVINAKNSPNVYNKLDYDMNRFMDLLNHKKIRIAKYKYEEPILRSIKKYFCKQVEIGADTTTFTNNPAYYIVTEPEDIPPNPPPQQTPPTPLKEGTKIKTHMSPDFLRFIQKYCEFDIDENNFDFTL